MDTSDRGIVQILIRTYKEQYGATYPLIDMETFQLKNWPTPSDDDLVSCITAFFRCEDSGHTLESLVAIRAILAQEATFREFNPQLRNAREIRFRQKDINYRTKHGLTKVTPYFYLSPIDATINMVDREYEKLLLNQA